MTREERTLELVPSLFLPILLALAACGDQTLRPPKSDKNYDDSDDPGHTMPGATPDAAADALPDGQGKACSAQTDCAAPLRCIFPIALGCGAKGTCALYTNPPGCASNKACGCDDMDVVLCSPEGTAPAPVKSPAACATDAASE